MGLWSRVADAFRTKAPQQLALPAPIPTASAMVPYGGGASSPFTPPTALEQQSGGLPAIRREPPIQIAPDFKTVDDIKGVITLLDFGQFQLASWLIEQMFWNSRLRGVNNTRWEGLVGTRIRWEVGRQNEVARRAARDIVEDWPLIVTAATRKQIAKWGLNLGVSFAQKHWYQSPTSGRWIPRLEHYHPQWSLWDWSLRAYRVWTMDGWAIVPSPALMVPGQDWTPSFTPGGNDKADTLRRWLVHEPFGQHSWREGMVHSSWDPWFGLTLANRNLHRSSEKMGLGIVKLKYPRSSDKGPLATLTGGLQRLGREAVIPVEVYPEGSDEASYDVEPFEWTQSGADIIRSDREACSADLAVLYLGHNTTAETKGASVGASAQVGNLIRSDIRIGDTYAEWATIYLQVIRDWADVNYGDAGVAPIPVYVTDPPSENVAASQVLFNVMQAIEKGRQVAPGVDWDEVLASFSAPLKPGGAKVPPPAPEPAPRAAGAAPPPKSSKAQTAPPAPADDDENDEGDA